jgi:hypothetical protein
MLTELCVLFVGDSIKLDLDISFYSSGSQSVVRVPLGVRENDIGNGEKHKKR